MVKFSRLKKLISKNKIKDAPDNDTIAESIAKEAAATASSESAKNRRSKNASESSSGDRAPAPFLREEDIAKIRSVLAEDKLAARVVEGSGRGGTLATHEEEDLFEGLDGNEDIPTTIPIESPRRKAGSAVEPAFLDDTVSTFSEASSDEEESENDSDEDEDEDDEDEDEDEDDGNKSREERDKEKQKHDTDNRINSNKLATQGVTPTAGNVNSLYQSVTDAEPRNPSQYATGPTVASNARAKLKKSPVRKMSTVMHDSITEPSTSTEGGSARSNLIIAQGMTGSKNHVPDDSPKRGQPKRGPSKFTQEHESVSSGLIASDDEDDESTTHTEHSERKQSHFHHRKVIKEQDSRVVSEDEGDSYSVNSMDDGTYADETYVEEESVEVSRVGMYLSESKSTSEAGTFMNREKQKGRGDIKNSTSQKDIVVHKCGEIDSMVVRATNSIPELEHHSDVILKIDASTVSFRDCLLRLGIGMHKVPFPFIPGCEIVGEIVRLGRGAKQAGHREGDRVAAVSQNGGGNAKFIRLACKSVIPIPEGVDAPDAACLIKVYMTAYQSLRIAKKNGSPLTEANVLVTDGFSPVGQAAVVLAKLEGATVYVTTTDHRQDAYLTSLGAKCLPLSPAKWLPKLKGKMDVVIDIACFDSYDSSWKALNAQGILVCTGMSSIYQFEDYSNRGCHCDSFGDTRDYQAHWAATKAKYMMSRTYYYDFYKSFRTDANTFKQEFKYLCFILTAGRLKPKIAERITIDEVPDAQRFLETGKANGTVVCLPGYDENA